MLSEQNQKLVGEIAPSRAEQSIARLYSELLERLLNAARQQGRDERKDGWVNNPYVADLKSEISRIPVDFPNYGTYDIGLPAGHWRLLLPAAPAPEGD